LWPFPVHAADRSLRVGQAESCLLQPETLAACIEGKTRSCRNRVNLEWQINRGKKHLPDLGKIPGAYGNICCDVKPGSDGYITVQLKVRCDTADTFHMIDITLTRQSCGQFGDSFW